MHTGQRAGRPSFMLGPTGTAPDGRILREDAEADAEADTPRRCLCSVSLSPIIRIHRADPAYILTFHSIISSQYDSAGSCATVLYGTPGGIVRRSSHRRRVAQLPSSNSASSSPALRAPTRWVATCGVMPLRRNRS